MRCAASCGSSTMRPSIRCWNSQEHPRLTRQSERLLVAVGPSPLSERLVCAARRLAEALSAEWWAVSVRGAALSEAAEERVSRHLQLAESLGARTEVVSGLGIAEAVLEFARENNVTKIVAGKPLGANWWRRDLVDQLVRGSGDIDIFVVSGQGEAATPRPPLDVVKLPEGAVAGSADHGPVLSHQSSAGPHQPGHALLADGDGDGLLVGARTFGSGQRALGSSF